MYKPKAGLRLALAQLLLPALLTAQTTSHSLLDPRVQDSLRAHRAWLDTALLSRRATQRHVNSIRAGVFGETPSFDTVRVAQFRVLARREHARSVQEALDALMPKMQKTAPALLGTLVSQYQFEVRAWPRSLDELTFYSIRAREPSSKVPTVSANSSSLEQGFAVVLDRLLTAQLRLEPWLELPSGIPFFSERPNARFDIAAELVQTAAATNRACLRGSISDCLASFDLAGPAAEGRWYSDEDWYWRVADLPMSARTTIGAASRCLEHHNHDCRTAYLQAMPSAATAPPAGPWARGEFIKYLLQHTDANAIDRLSTSDGDLPDRLSRAAGRPLDEVMAGFIGELSHAATLRSGAVTYSRPGNGPAAWAGAALFCLFLLVIAARRVPQ